MAQTRIMPGDTLLEKSPDPAKELFYKMSAQAGRHVYTAEHVADAGMCVFMQGVRQNCQTRAEAEKFFDRCVANAKAIIMQQFYDAVTGKRRHNFAFDQELIAQGILAHSDDDPYKRH